LKVKDVEQIIETWAPRRISWEGDNVGLQVGDSSATLRGIVICLDPNEEVLHEARVQKANLVISHHPLLFKPLQAVTPDTWTGRCVAAYSRWGINLYSAHTNLDFTRGGTSFALAEILGLNEVEFLHTPYQVQRKIVTFVPADHVESIAGAMARAGAGRIGNYEQCSFRIEGTGTFMGTPLSSPVAGRKGHFEKVPEIRLEMVASQWHLPGVLSALQQSHPYEEVAYDVYPLDNFSGDYGMGAIGTLAREQTLEAFLKSLKRALGTSCVRHTGELRKGVRRIAVCGGSGSELAQEAIRQKADAFVTADVKYHTFQDAAGRIALIDAGHFETEHPVLAAIARKLRKELRTLGQSVPLHIANTWTNPIRYY
jgi:dinuclear metal center YbgI/SA1388 family protein